MDVGGSTAVAKIKKQDWQVEILRQKYTEGLTATGKPHSGKLDEASKATGLPLQVVKDWILNQRKPDRSQKGCSVKVNEYTAFAKSYKPAESGVTLGELAKERAKAYQELKTTAQGQTELKECLKEAKSKLNEVDQREQLIKKNLKTIEECAIRLRNHDVMVSCIVARSGKLPYVIGCYEGVYFFGNRPQLLQEYGSRVLMPSGERSAVQQEDTRSTLRHKVQILLNEKYLAASGKTNGALPYRKAAENRLGFKVTLPDNIRLKKPSEYSMTELRAILNGKDSITFIPSVIEDGEPELRSSEEDYAVPGTSTGQENIFAASGSTVDLVDPSEIEDVDENIPDGRDENVIALQIHGSDNTVENVEDDNIVSLQNVQSAEEVIKEIQKRHGARKASKRGVEKVEKLWAMDDGSRKWFQGSAKRMKGGHLKVKWEDSVSTTISKKEVDISLKEKTFRFCDSS